MNLRHFLVLGSALVLAAPAVAADEKPARKPVARCAAETGVLLRREAPEKPWRTVADKEALSSNDLLLAIDVGGALVSNNGAVKLSFRGDYHGNSPFPVLETAVVLNVAADGFDLDVTLDRGRIDLVNSKEKGPARVRVRVQDRDGEVTLTEPGARVAVEIYGRWPRGVPFTKDPKPEDRPALAIVILAIKGEVDYNAIIDTQFLPEDIRKVIE